MQKIKYKNIALISCLEIIILIKEPYQIFSIKKQIHCKYLELNFPLAFTRSEVLSKKEIFRKKAVLFHYIKRFIFHFQAYLKNEAKTILLTSCNLLFRFLLASQNRWISFILFSVHFLSFYFIFC